MYIYIHIPKLRGFHQNAFSLRSLYEQIKYNSDYPYFKSWQMFFMLCFCHFVHGNKSNDGSVIEEVKLIFKHSKNSL